MKLLDLLALGLAWSERRPRPLFAFLKVLEAKNRAAPQSQTSQNDDEAIASYPKLERPRRITKEVSYIA